MKLIKDTKSLKRLNVWLGFFIFPFFVASASSDLDEIWSGVNKETTAIYFPIDFEGFSNFTKFFIYLLVIIGGIFALSSIMVGAIKMSLSSGNEDVHHGAQQSLIAGSVSLGFSISI